LSIVIPAFNESESLPVLCREIAETMRSASDYEVLLIDDGSSDSTLDVMRSLAARDERVRVFHRPVNAGQSAALLAGFRAARAPVIVTLDADLQNDPHDIPRLLEALDDGADVVSGVRTVRKDSPIRRLSSSIANGVRRRVLHDGATDVGCSLKAYRAEFVRSLPPFDGAHRFLPALVRMQGARFVEIPVNHRKREFGESSYGVSNRLWRGIVDMLGVLWLARRWKKLEGVEEIREAAAQEAGDRNISG
jgi:glycosyltransferase involved in cell wall biosynthesis